ncbi:MAG: GAF and ANTAR domain-containing protein [Actinomycetota bacterium]|nr:GAF and ANTAR domain-containing protein [Actinomycetota bacterium]
MKDGYRQDDFLGPPDQVRALIELEPTRSDDPAGTALVLKRICRVAARILPAQGVAVSLMTEQGPTGIVAALDKASGVVEELQFLLGEGPGWDAFETRAPVLVPDLQAGGAQRWPGYCAAVGAHGMRAAFAFPLFVGSARLGVLGIYRAEPGRISDETLAVALSLADLATETLLDGQEEAGASGIPPGVDAVLESRFAVYQAQGMVMVQLGVPLTEALARLRAYAYSEDRTLGAVSRDVVARTLSLEADQR